MFLRGTTAKSGQRRGPGGLRGRRGRVSRRCARPPLRSPAHPAGPTAASSHLTRSSPRAPTAAGGARFPSPVIWLSVSESVAGAQAEEQEDGVFCTRWTLDRAPGGRAEARRRDGAIRGGARHQGPGPPEGWHRLPRRRSLCPRPGWRGLGRAGKAAPRAEASDVTTGRVFRGGARALPARAGSPDCGSIRDGGRAGQPGQEGEIQDLPTPAGSAGGGCPTLGSRRCEAERLGPGAARAALSRPAGAAARQGAGRLQGRPGWLGRLRPGGVTRAGSPAAATGAEPPRDRPQSRSA